MGSERNQIQRGAGKLCLSPIMNLYNGEIVAWQSYILSAFDLVWPGRRHPEEGALTP